jgi:hypothetical protein
MKIILLMAQFVTIFSLKLCSNCKHYSKGKCSLFPLLNEETHETQFLDWTRARKIYYFCGEKGRYYEPYDKNEPLELPDDYDFETYIQLL